MACLGNREPEAFREALLDDHAGMSLELVDNERVFIRIVPRDRRQVHIQGLGETVSLSKPR